MTTYTYKPTAEETEASTARLRELLTPGARLYMVDRGTDARSLFRVHIVADGWDGIPELMDITLHVARATGYGQKERRGRMGIPMSDQGMSRAEGLAYAISRVVFPGASRSDFRTEVL